MNPYVLLEAWMKAKIWTRIGGLERAKYDHIAKSCSLTFHMRKIVITKKETSMV